MDLAIFDLDNTLLSGDSDFLWGQFLVQKNCVDAEYYEEKNQFFYDEYNSGRLNINDFLEFSLKPLSDISFTKLENLHNEFMQEKIIPIITKKSLDLIKKHRKQGDFLLIITATNQFVTEPISNYLQMDDIIATVPELKDGEYTGNVSGSPSFQEGKVKRLDDWLNQHPNLSLKNSYFYSDSINDLPLLEKVTYPIAVDPDELLLKKAEQNKWDIISLR